MTLNKWTKRIMFFTLVAFFVGFIIPVLVGFNVLKHQAEAAERVKELQQRVRFLKQVDSMQVAAKRPPARVNVPPAARPAL